MELISAILKEEALLAAMDQAVCRMMHRHMHGWWLGQSGFLLQWKGKACFAGSLSVRFPH
jgi:hypothetical protein